ncbi:MAG: hypothetical protein LIP16_01440 [Clostridium sp.]|nr:hypothetical protein [Clostridium sp.]
MKKGKRQPFRTAQKNKELWNYIFRDRNSESVPKRIGKEMNEEVEPSSMARTAKGRPLILSPNKSNGKIGPSRILYKNPLLKQPIVCHR